MAPEDELLQQACDGDEKALGKLLDLHAPELRRVVAGKLSTKWQSLLSEEDVLQETFTDATEYACSKGYFPDCHQGWGTRMMAKYWPKHHYTFMKTLKGAMDPNNIMNPGVWDL